MRRRLAAILVTIVWALGGAAAGHVVAEMRRRSDAGDSSTLRPEDLLPRPQAIVPGLVAAMRVRERPWSFLHIPPWMAAFVVNFAVAVVSSEFRSAKREDEEAIEGVALTPPVAPTPPAPPPTNGDAHRLEPEGFTAFAE